MESSRYAPPKADLGTEGTAGSQSWNTLETPATVWIKRIAAVGLAAGFFLPLTSCSGHDYSAATAYDWPSFGCCAEILLFFWPSAYEIALSFVTRSHPELGNPWPRVVLIGGTLLGITWLVYWGILREQYPDQTAEFSNDQLAAPIPELVARAAGYGLVDEQSAATLVLNAWLLGPDFDQRIPGLQQILSSTQLSPGTKADALTNFSVTVFHELEQAKAAA